MKGIVFTEFLEMVESKLGLGIADRILESFPLASGGAYTAVGTYDHHELVALVGELSRITGAPFSMLVSGFGKHLFGRFAELYPQFFVGVGSAFEFLQKVEGYVHVEVRKLYPDAELPTFECEASGPGELIMMYRSKRPFADLAEGLIEGCFEYFGESVKIEKQPQAAGPETCVRFVLRKQAASLEPCLASAGDVSGADFA